MTHHIPECRASGILCQGVTACCLVSPVAMSGFARNVRMPLLKATVYMVEKRFKEWRNTIILYVNAPCAEIMQLSDLINQPIRNCSHFVALKAAYVGSHCTFCGVCLARPMASRQRRPGHAHDDDSSGVEEVPISPPTLHVPAPCQPTNESELLVQTCAL